MKQKYKKYFAKGINAKKTAYQWDDNRNPYIRNIYRQTSFIMNNKKLDIKGLLISYSISIMWSKSILGKRPRMINWLFGKNKY